MVLAFALFVLQTGLWNSIPPMPSARQEVGVAAVEGRVYVVGGVNAVGVGQTTLDIFDTRTNQWRTGPPLPLSLHHPNGAAVGTKVYVAGGYAGATGFPSGATFELDVDRMVWTQKADMPTARGAGAAVGYNGRLYVFGGERGTSVTDVAIFDPATDSWTTAAPMPTPRNHMGAAAVRGKIYVVGGRPGNLAVNEMYDPLTDSWTSKAPMPTGRSGHAVASLNNSVYAFGGEGNDASAVGTFAQSESYDADLDSWTSLPPMATPRHGIGAGVVGNRIFLPAGAVVAGLGATASSDFFAVQQELLIPQFVAGGGYSTSIVVTNPDSSRTATVTVSVDGVEGPGTIRLNVPALSSRTVPPSTPASSPLRIGIVRVAADSRITAYAVIRGVGPQLTVYPGAPTRNVIFNVQRIAAAGNATGVAIANMSGQTATVTMRLHNDSGEEVSRYERTLAAGEQISRFVHQLFADFENADFLGTVTVRSTQQLVVSALGFDPSGVVTLPAVPID
jgi:N-acetylneuraminic acid mutarotase